MKFKLTNLLILLLIVVILVSATFYPMTEGMGVRRNDILEGDEDLYILKSQVVPPVCPKCPDVAACPRQKPCPPCPPCARCPEPAFTCKKVPNYTSRNQSELPLPMLNTFAAFK
jgi:hypothetical protein